MKQDYIEKIIDEKIKRVPDFSHVEKKLGFPEKPRKTRHAPTLKRVLALFLGVLIIGGAVLGGARLLEDGTLGDGGHSSSGIIEPRLNIFNYSIWTDKLNYEIGEEITVTWALRCNRYSKEYLLAKPLYFRLKPSESFETVGDSECVIEDFDPANYNVGDVMAMVSFKIIATEEFTDVEQVRLEIKAGFRTNEEVDGGSYSWFTDVNLFDNYQIKSSAKFVCNRFADGIVSYYGPNTTKLDLATHLVRRNNIKIAFSADIPCDISDYSITLEGLELTSEPKFDGKKIKFTAKHDGSSGICSADIAIKLGDKGYFTRTIYGIVDGRYIYFDDIYIREGDAEKAVMDNYLLFLQTYNPLRYEYLTTMNRSPDTVTLVNYVLIFIVTALLLLSMHKLVGVIRTLRQRSGHISRRKPMLRRRIAVLISATVLCALAFGAFGAYCGGRFIKAPNSTEKERETYQSFLSLDEDNKADFVNFNKHFIYKSDQDIHLTVATDFKCEVVDYKLKCRNFEKISDIDVADDEITFTLRYSGERRDSANASLSVLLADGTEKKLLLYGECKGDALFLGSGDHVLIGESEYVQGNLIAPSTANYIEYLRDYNPIMYEYETTPHTVFAVYEIVMLCQVAFWGAIVTEALYLIIGSKHRNTKKNGRRRNEKGYICFTNGGYAYDERCDGGICRRTH